MCKYTLYLCSLIHTVREESKRMPLADVGAGTKLLSDYCVLSELRHLKIGNIIKLKQVWLLDIVGYGFPVAFYYLFMNSCNDLCAQWEGNHSIRESTVC